MHRLRRNEVLPDSGSFAQPHRATICEPEPGDSDDPIQISQVRVGHQQRPMARRTLQS